jgi:hypothetical protein
MFEGIDLSLVYGPLVAIGFAIVLIILIYKFYYKPRMEMPLPHERRLNYWTIWLKEHGVHTGYVTTAAQTLQSLLSETLRNETEPNEKKKLEAFKEALEKVSPVAQKFEGKTCILLFNRNPEDQKFLAIDPDRSDGYILNGVEDVVGGVEWKGMDFFGVKLGAEVHGFSEEDKQLVDMIVEGCKYLRDTARNTDKIHLLKEELQGEREAKEKAQKQGAEMRSKLDAALYALEQKLLSVEKSELPLGLKQVVKRWFGDPIQWILAGVGFFFVGPYLLQGLAWNWQPPMTTYFAAFVAFLLFFAPPVLKRLFGRWL